MNSIVKKIKDNVFFDDVCWVLDAIVFAFTFVFFLKPAFARTELTATFMLAVAVIYSIVDKRNSIGTREMLVCLSMFAYGYILGEGLWLKNAVLMLTAVIIFSKVVSTHFQRYDYRLIYAFVCVFVLGVSLYSLLDTIYCFGNSYGYGSRVWPEFWSKVNMFATLHALFACPVVALAFPAILFFRKHKIASSLVLIACVYQIFFAFYSSTRTQLLVFAIVFFLEFLLYIIFNRNLFKSKRKSLIKIGAVVVGVVAVFAIAVAVNAFHIRDTKLFSSIFGMITRDGGILNNIRFVGQRKALMQILVYPMGGSQMDIAGLSHCHNVWLQMANEAGLIPFVLFVIYTVVTFIDLIKLMKNKSVEMELKYLLFALYMSMILFYTVENALRNSIYEVTPWMFVNGVISSYAINQRGIKFRKKETV